MSKAEAERPKTAHETRAIAATQGRTIFIRKASFSIKSRPRPAFRALGFPGGLQLFLHFNCLSPYRQKSEKFIPSSLPA
jgi:hypothetical protein